MNLQPLKQQITQLRASMQTQLDQKPIPRFPDPNHKTYGVARKSLALLNRLYHALDDMKPGDHQQIDMLLSQVRTDLQSYVRVAHSKTFVAQREMLQRVCVILQNTQFQLQALKTSSQPAVSM